MRDNKRKVIILGIISILMLLGFAPGVAAEYSFSQKNRDPFSPLVNKLGLILIPREIGFAGLDLKGIIYSQENSVVVINGEVLKEGDTIGDYFILKIEEKKVILKKDNKGFTLKLEE